MGVPCGDENAHGIPFEAIPLSPSHAGGERKGKSCGAISEEKVPTRGFSAKKEGVWRDLRTKGADSRIFGEKENRVARPPCHFPQLGEKGRWVVQPQLGKVPTRGFSVKKETVWRDLQKFFISLFTSTD